MIQSDKTLLRLVHDRDSEGQLDQSAGHFEPLQSSILDSLARRLVVFTTDSLDESSFIELVTNIRPTMALDLRATPRFDFGSLNRRRVLALFDALNVKYYDLGVVANFDENMLRALQLVSSTKELIEPSDSATIAIFVDPKPDYRVLGLRLVAEFRRTTGVDWEVVLNGPSTAPADERRAIFISHATEDNEFVLWLQAQLTKHGFETWSDLTELKAGETFWDTIEQVIRTRAAKVLVVVSRTAMTKPNVLDEISLAISIERAEDISNFVIPVRIDDLPFVEFRANIARKNTIDYSRGWSRGLFQLLDTLKRDQVPQRSGAGPSQLSAWWESRRIGRSKIEQKPENLLSNQFLIEGIPQQVFQFEGLPIEERTASSQYGSSLPLASNGRNWLSFFSTNELLANGIAGLSWTTTTSTEELLNGNASFVRRLNPAERKRLFHGLLNRHWEWFLLSKGLLQHESTTRGRIFYFPTGLLTKDQIEFVDIDGVERRRKVVGYSAKRNMFWHLGLTGRFLNETDLMMRLRTSVVFSEDGTAYTASKERTKDLRRQFCKNWWNDRWRTLQVAATTWLAGDSSSIVIHAGEAGRFAISTRGIVLTVPIGIREDVTATSVEKDFSESDNDSMDDFDDWEDNESSDSPEIL